jgi:hypothetical protein
MIFGKDTSTVSLFFTACSASASHDLAIARSARKGEPGRAKCLCTSVSVHLRRKYERPTCDHASEGVRCPADGVKQGHRVCPPQCVKWNGIEQFAVSLAKSLPGRRGLSNAASKPLPQTSSRLFATRTEYHPAPQGDVGVNLHRLSS